MELIYSNRNHCLYLKRLFLVEAVIFNRRHSPANICWSSTRLQRLEDIFKRCLQDVFKTCLQDILSRRLEDVFSVTILRLPRRLEDILKSFSRPLARLLEGVFKTSWKTKNCYAEDVFMTSWRHALKTSRRHVLKTSSWRLGGKQNFYWWYLDLTNLNVYLTNLCFTSYIWEI